MKSRPFQLCHSNSFQGGNEKRSKGRRGCSLNSVIIHTNDVNGLKDHFTRERSCSLLKNCWSISQQEVQVMFLQLESVSAASNMSRRSDFHPWKQFHLTLKDESGTCSSCLDVGDVYPIQLQMHSTGPVYTKLDVTLLTKRHRRPVELKGSTDLNCFTPVDPLIGLDTHGKCVLDNQSIL